MSFADFIIKSNQPKRRGRPVKYKTEEDRLNARRASAARWRAANREYASLYYQRTKDAPSS